MVTIEHLFATGQGKPIIPMVEKGLVGFMDDKEGFQPFFSLTPLFSGNQELSLVATNLKLEYLERRNPAYLVTWLMSEREIWTPRAYLGITPIGFGTHGEVLRLQHIDAITGDRIGIYEWVGTSTQQKKAPTLEETQKAYWTGAALTPSKVRIHIKEALVILLSKPVLVFPKRNKLPLQK